MKITNIDWNTLAENAELNLELNNKNWSFLQPFYLISFDHLLPVFAAVPLIRNSKNKISATETLKNMPDVVDTINGPITKNTVMNMLKLIYHAPRSKLLLKPQNKEPRFGSYTPIFMYAHKLHNNVMYEEWDKDDKWLKFLLGRQLEWLLHFDRDIKIVLNDAEFEHNREVMLTTKTGLNAGNQAALTAYKCNAKHVRVETEGGWDYIPMPKMALIMLMQTWICNASVRYTSGCMILDPYNWDAIPVARDTSIPKKEPVPWPLTGSKKEPIGDDIPWDLHT